MVMRSFLTFALLTAVVVGLLTGCASTPRHYNVGYTQEGIASWYGSDFNGKLTADGETFNMNAMTAAHLHLPFGSLVRVTNKDNGRSVDVRINDRGPYEDDRIIDLSSAAADVLQMKHDGTVPVEIELLQVGSGHYVKQ